MTFFVPFNSMKEWKSDRTLFTFYFYTIYSSLSTQNNLASLLKTAEELRIKGLAEVSWRDDDGENPESNDNNNNNVTETNSSFPLLAQQPSNHHQSSTLSSSSSSTNQSQMGPSSLQQSERKEYDNKENLLKAMPFLAPLSSPKDLSNRKKRGRPPLDESNNFARG